MEGFAGYNGCYLLCRKEGDQVHIQLLSLWDSLASIRGFAGSDESTAVISPAVADLMTEYDTTAGHDTVVVDTVTGRGDGGPATPNQDTGS
ncbi:hypothetical protein [Streptomyces sp. LaBMicrA B280]|uniref:hypothetical protein n=1 Tax=Streptomyces sp. LaBMicrA B280 TaxID=3391001 RepID=UPI003BA576B8